MEWVYVECVCVCVGGGLWYVCGVSVGGVCTADTYVSLKIQHNNAVL